MEKFKSFSYEKCWDHLEKIKKFLKLGFYFSPTYAIQSKFRGKIRYSPMELTSDISKNVHIWNYNSLKIFIQKPENIDFFYPIIQGYVE